MSPLLVEAYIAEKQRWIEFMSIQPGKEANLTNNRTDGRHEIILFACAEDNSFSQIERVSPNLEIDIYTDTKTINPEQSHIKGFDRKNSETLARLTSKDDPYILTIRTDISMQANPLEDPILFRRKLIRFTHTDEPIVVFEKKINRNKWQERLDKTSKKKKR